MTRFIAYAPQIANYFNVTKEHVIEVYRQTQIFESQVLLQILLVLGVIIGIAAFVGFLLGYFWGNKDIEMGFLTAIVFGIIAFVIAGVIAGYYWDTTVLANNPEYANWITYMWQTKIGS